MIISSDKRSVSTGDHENESVPLFAWKELLGIIDFAQLVITLNKTRYYVQHFVKTVMDRYWYGRRIL